MREALDLRLPNLTEGTEAEQLRQIRSYLWQLTAQLQYALGSSAETGGASAGSSGGLTFSAIRSMLLRSSEVVNTLSGLVQQRLAGEYVRLSEYSSFADQTAAELRELSRAAEALQSQLDRLDSFLQIRLDAHGVWLDLGGPAPDGFRSRLQFLPEELRIPEGALRTEELRLGDCCLTADPAGHLTLA